MLETIISSINTAILCGIYGLGFGWSIMGALNAIKDGFGERINILMFALCLTASFIFYKAFTFV